MRVSREGEYALRAMIELALRHGEGPVSVAAISERESIPKEFLQQILRELRQAGLVHSTRGVQGGYSLQRSPERITLAEVLRVIDGPLAPLSCVSSWAHRPCERERSCGLYSVMLDVRNAIAGILESTTLEDVCLRTKVGPGRRAPRASIPKRARARRKPRPKRGGRR